MHRSFQLMTDVKHGPALYPKQGVICVMPSITLTPRSNAFKVQNVSCDLLSSWLEEGSITKLHNGWQSAGKNEVVIVVIRETAA